MKKHVLSFTILLCMAYAVMGQAVFTSQAGPYSDPNTWGCNCVPTNASYSRAELHHAVTLDMDLTDPPELVIQPSGSLIEDATPRTITTTEAIYGAIEVSHLHLKDNALLAISSTYIGKSITLHDPDTEVRNLVGNFILENKLHIIEGLYNAAGGSLEVDTIQLDSGTYQSRHSLLNVQRVMTGPQLPSPDSSDALFHLAYGMAAIGDMVMKAGKWWFMENAKVEIMDSMYVQAQGIVDTNIVLFVYGDLFNGMDSSGIGSILRMNRGSKMKVDGNFSNGFQGLVAGWSASICIEGESFNEGWITGQPDDTLHICDLSGNGQFDIDNGSIVLVNYCTESCNLVSNDPFEPQTPNFSVFPNPTSGRMIIEQEPASLLPFEVLNVWGQQVYVESKPSSRTEINLAGKAPGVYWIRMGQHSTKVLLQ